MVTTEHAARFLLHELDYKRVPEYQAYFDSIRPRDDAELFRRGLFALASVHTSWEMNCELYAQLWDFDKWIGNPMSLKRGLEDSRAGLMNNRFKFFNEFAKTFWACPRAYRRGPHETWAEFRDRVEKMTPGLGIAKSAFFIELSCFHDANVVCVDTWMLQLGGYSTKDIGKGKVRDKDVLLVSDTWVAMCKTHDVSPVTARWLQWDYNNGQSSSRYWSYVLEGRPEPRTQSQPWLFPEYQ